LSPIEALMQEHRLIERMISQMRKNLAAMEEAQHVNSKFVDVAVDFIRVYADRCHHGKEEGILFRELGSKQMAQDHSVMMQKLIEEHAFARRATSSLAKANEGYVNGNRDARKDVYKFMQDLIELYPQHVEKEDNKFFGPSMEYFTAQEQEAMLGEFWEFDRKIVHEHYGKVLDELEKTVSV